MPPYPAVDRPRCRPHSTLVAVFAIMTTSAVCGQAPLHELASPNMERFGRFGVAVAGVSDLDGDGRGDLLIGADSEAPGASPYWAGRAYVFSGAGGAVLHAL